MHISPSNPGLDSDRQASSEKFRFFAVCGIFRGLWDRWSRRGLKPSRMRAGIENVPKCPVPKCPTFCDSHRAIVSPRGEAERFFLSQGSEERSLPYGSRRNRARERTQSKPAKNRIGDAGIGFWDRSDHFFARTNPIGEKVNRPPPVLRAVGVGRLKFQERRSARSGGRRSSWCGSWFTREDDLHHLEFLAALGIDAE